MSDQERSFAAYLAAITDDAERARVLARVKMLAVNEAPEEAFQAPIRTLAEYLATPIEVPPVLVNPFIVVRGGLTATIGRAGKGKTVMNLNRILKWGAGKPIFPGWTNAEGDPILGPDRPLKTLIIENEGAGGLFHRQIGIMLHAKGFLSEPDRELARENVLVWGDGGYSNLKLDDPNKLNGVRAGIEQWEPDIVFVEPFRGLWQGEENSSTDMAVVIDNLVSVATEYGVGVMLSHHESKGGENYEEKMSRARGSTVLEGAVTVMENFESVLAGEQRELSWSKSRHAEPPIPVRMEWVPDSWWYKWVPTDSIEDAIIEALRGNAEEAMTIADLVEETGDKSDKLRKVCKFLVDDGKIKKMPSLHSGSGSTGFRYRLANNEENQGGLEI